MHPLWTSWQHRMARRWMKIVGALTVALLVAAALVAVQSNESVQAHELMAPRAARTSTEQAAAASKAKAPATLPTYFKKNTPKRKAGAFDLNDKALRKKHKDTQAPSDAKATMRSLQASGTTTTAFISGNVSYAAGPSKGSLVLLFAPGVEDDVRDTRTDESGNWVISDLDPGTYTIEFLCNSPDNSCESEWYKDAPLRAEATYFTVKAGDQLTNVDSVCPQEAKISGKITAADTGLPVTYTGVYAYAYDGSIVGITADVDSDGSYVIRSMPATRVTLQFTVGSEAPYAPTYWGHHTLARDAEYFNLTAGQTTANRDQALDHDVEIEGTTYFPDGSPAMGDVYALLRDGNNPPIGIGSPGFASYADGKYHIGQLPAGTYSLWFYYGDYRYRKNMYWSHAYKLADATYFPGANGQVITGRDNTFTLVPAATPAEQSGGPNLSENVCQCRRQDPINTATGEFFENSTDLDLPGVGPAVSLARTYSSSSVAKVGPFGYGTASNVNTRLVVTTAPQSGQTLPQAVSIMQENGSTVPFVLDAYNNYVGPARVFATLTWNATAQRWTLVRRLKETLTFDSAGKLLSVKDLNGNTTTYAYNANGQVTTVSGSGGRSITLTWTGGVVTKATDSAGRSVSYTYSAANDLASVKTVDGATTAFTYSSAHLLLTKTKPTTGVVTNAYDASNRVVMQTDPLQRATTFAYSGDMSSGDTTTTYPDGSVLLEHYSEGNLVTKTIANGTSVAARSTYSYDASGNQTDQYDPLGNHESKTFDENGNALTETDALGHTSTLSYDALGDVLSRKDALGRATTATYDAAGNRLTLTSPSGRVNTWTYNADGTPSTLTDGNGKKSTYGYSSTGLLTSTKDPNALTTATAYNAVGFVTSLTDGLGKVTSRTVDAAGRTLTQTDPLSRVTTYTYDADGNNLSIKDPAGNTRKNTFDLADEKLTAVDELGKTTTYTYTANGLPATVKDANAHTTTTKYNAAEQAISITDANNHVTKFTYDLNGHVLTTQRPSGATTTSTYDAVGNVLSAKDPKGNVTTKTYDADNEPLTTTDAVGRTTTTAYTDDGQVAKVTKPGGASESYVYDLVGNTTRFTNADGKATTYSFDPGSRLLSKTDPGAMTTSYTYDAAGRVLTTTAPDASVLTNTYDAAGQLTKEHSSISGSTDSTFMYTATGLRATMVDATGTTSYTYDAARHLTATKNGAGASVSYTYDPVGQQLTAVYPTSHTVTFSYDAVGNMSSVKDWNSHTTSFTWTADDKLATQTDPNGLKQTNTFDANDQLTKSAVTNGTTAVATYSSTFDAGRQLSGDTTVDPSTTGTSHTYTYDAQRQLSAVTTGSTTGTYLASAAGVLSATPTATLTTNAAQQVTALTPKTGAATSFAYNGAGSRNTSTLAAAGSTPAATTKYTYDPQNHLSSVVLPGSGGTIAYKNDRDGLRQTRTVGSTTTKFLWGTQGSLPVVFDDGTYSYIYGPGGLPVEQITDANATVQYTFHDTVGSTRLITSSTGTTTGTSTYDAYGNRTGQTGAGASNIGFAGNWTDPTSKLVYMRDRDYDAATGQFLQVDRLVDKTRQPYAYVGNDPLDRTDPLGLSPCDNNKFVSGKDVFRQVGAGEAHYILTTYGADNHPEMWARLWAQAQARLERSLLPTPGLSISAGVISTVGAPVGQFPAGDFSIGIGVEGCLFICLSGGVAYQPSTNHYYFTGSVGIGLKEQAVAYVRADTGTPGASVSVNVSGAFGLGVTAGGSVANGQEYGAGGGVLFGEGVGASMMLNGAVRI